MTSLMMEHEVCKKKEKRKKEEGTQTDAVQNILTGFYTQLLKI